MTAIEASSAGVRDMADGSLRITLEFEPRHARDAYALFGSRGTPVAVAALKPARSEPQKEEKPKGGELARLAGMWCNDPAFHRWAQDGFPTQWESAAGATPAAWAASVIRAVCAIESRAELDNDDAAAKRFDLLIRRPYMKHAGGL